MRRAARRKPARGVRFSSLREGTRSVNVRRERSGELGPQKSKTLADCNAALQQEGANLIDDAGALADKSLAHAVQGLQVELIAGLGSDELHGRALHRLGDRLSIAEVVLLSLRIRRTYFAGISRVS
jgi:hypothetical protein